MKFNIRALTPEQEVVQTVIEAPDEAEARKQMLDQGFYVSAVSVHGAGLSWASASSQGVKGFSLLLFSQELLSLLKAGLGIVETLEALIEKEGSQTALRPVLQRLLTGLRDGKRFSTVLAEQPALFPPLYIGVVKAAEGTSDLPRSLERFIAYQERIDVVRNKVVSAAIYPSILIGVGGTVSLFLMVYVVPKFAQVYQGTGREMPWMSQMMLAFGDFVSAHTETVMLSLALLAALIVLGYRKFKTNGGILRLLSRMPGVSERVKIYELSRLYLTLGMLLEGGIPLLQAMQTIQDVVSVGMAPKLTAARDMIASGETLSKAFQTHDLTTPISLRMLSVGERSGEMGPMLTQSAQFYDGEITRWIDRFMRSFEPILMAAIGLVVGVIVILLYMPIFDLAGSF
jgi:general secretion pathway protein F